MDKETFLNKITEIGTCEDEATRRELLTQLGEDTSSVFDDNAALTERNTQLTEANNTLTEANTKLFLRIGEERAPGTGDPGSQDPPPEKRKFEDLFNDKGEIK